MPIATPSQLAAYMQRDLDTSSAELAIELAEDAIPSAVADLFTTPLQRGVLSVVLAVAARAMTNPAGVRSEAIGGVSVGYKDGNSGAFLTEGELDSLWSAVGGRPTAYTVDLLDDGLRDYPLPSYRRCEGYR